MTGPAGRRWLRWAERGVSLLVVGFLAVYLVRNWSRVSAYEWSLDWGRIALASVGQIVVYSGFVVLWRHLLRALGSGPLTLADAHRIWYIGNLGRYVPGKVLQIAGTVYLSRSKGVSPVLAVAATVTSQVFILGTGVAVGAVALPHAAGEATRLRWIAIVCGAVFLLVLLTPLFERLYRLALRLSGRVEYHVPVPWKERLALTGGYAALWVVFGASFWLFVDGVTPVPGSAWWPLVGIFAIGYLAGYVAVFVPGGLGVREGVYAALLTLWVPATIAVAVAVLARLWSTVVELLVAGYLVVRYGIADLRAGAHPDLSPSDAHG